jgi:hypothetical protein
MTNNELNLTILSLKESTLIAHKTYFDKCSIGSSTTTSRQRAYLKAVNIYIRILDYYYGIPESEREDTSPITEDEILDVIAQADKLLDTFKSSYYAT